MILENTLKKKEEGLVNCAPCSKKNQRSKVFTVSTADNLNQLLFSLIPKYETIVLNCLWLNENENLRWQQKISKDYKACGCTTGAYFLITGFIVTIYFATSYWKLIFSSPLSYVCKILMFLCLCAIVGKIIGWCYAKIRLQLNILKLKQLIINCSTNNGLFGH